MRDLEERRDGIVEALVIGWELRREPDEAMTPVIAQKIVSDSHIVLDTLLANPMDEAALYGDDADAEAETDTEAE